LPTSRPIPDKLTYGSSASDRALTYHGLVLQLTGWKMVHVPSTRGPGAEAALFFISDIQILSDNLFPSLPQVLDGS